MHQAKHVVVAGLLAVIKGSGFPIDDDGVELPVEGSIVRNRWLGDKGLIGQG
jgi:hypothetical protein